MHKSAGESLCFTARTSRKTKPKLYLGIARLPGAAMIPHNSTLATCIEVAKVYLRTGNVPSFGIAKRRRMAMLPRCTGSAAFTVDKKSFRLIPGKQRIG